MKKVYSNIVKTAYFAAILLCFLPQISAALALVTGIILALLLTNPYPIASAKTSGYLLKLSVVGLGFGLPFSQVIATASSTFWITLASILFTFGCGIIIARLLRLDHKLSMLIIGGTAICGGSAIAALAPTVKANSHQLLTAIAIVFLLNALALIVFPPLGIWLNFDQTQFGIWSALAIHDTSSVVGAAAVFGDQALATATTTKLARALWIIPLVIITAWAFRAKSDNADDSITNKSAVLSKIKIPLFIPGFVLASLLGGLPWIQVAAPWLVILAKTGMKISLLLIGYGMSKESFRQLQLRPWLLGIILWLLVATASALVIKYII